MRLKMPAKIFISQRFPSPTKIARIRDYGADLVIEGDRYADALAAAEIWAQQNRRDAGACVRSERNHHGTGNGRVGVLRTGA